MASFLKKTLILCIVFLYSLSGKSTEVDTLRSIDIDTIIVSSIKRTNSKWNLPIATTTVSERVMQQKHLHDMKDFTAAIPNFIMVDRDTKLTSSVFIRGVGSLINMPGVAMYVDGVPHFEKSSFDVNLSEIEKIEFLRGPQGTLYGRNAMGGIILIHTRSPFRYQGTQFNLRYGSHTDFQLSASHLGKISPLLAYAISAHQASYGGYITNAYNGEKADKMRSQSINVRLEWRPKKNVSLRLINGLEHARQGAFTYGDVNEKTGRVDSVSTNHESFYDRKIYDGGLQIDYHNEWFWLRSQTSVQLLDDEYNVDQDASPRELYFAIQKEKQRLLSEEINIRTLSNGNYRWSFGAFAFRHAIDRSTDVYLMIKKPHYKLEKRYDDVSRGFALYHQSTFFITPQLQLEAGIRYDYEHATSIHNEHKVVEDRVEPLHKYDSPLTFSQWTPKVSLQYIFNRDTHLYATVAKGYKTGGFNTVFETEDQRTFAPEKSWNYEVGGKVHFIDNRLKAEMAIFYITIDQQQVRQHLDFQGVKIFNAGKAASKGLELSLWTKLSRNLSTNLSYGYTHATFTEYEYSNDVSYTGNFLPYIPRHTLSVSAEYSINYASAISDRIILNADYRGIGKLYWHENNRLEQPFYGLLNAGIQVIKNNTRVSLWGKNLTNTHYLGYYFEMSKRKLGKPGRPISLGISISQSF